MTTRQERIDRAIERAKGMLDATRRAYELGHDENAEALTRRAFELIEQAAKPAGGGS